jgi:hypothetical protein
MLAIRYRWKGKCPKHPRYDPVKGGEGAIKGTCPTCTLLFRVHEAHRMTAEIARTFDEVLGAGETVPMVHKIAGIVADQDRRIRDNGEAARRGRLRSAS